jgi:hypothetical protein
MKKNACVGAVCKRISYLIIAIILLLILLRYHLSQLRRVTFLRFLQCDLCDPFHVG